MRKLSISNFIHVADLVVVLVLLSSLSIIVTNHLMNPLAVVKEKGRTKGAFCRTC